MSTLYEMRLLNIPDRYRLSDTVLKILKAYDDFKIGRIDEAAMGRLIRLSPNNRAAVVDTIMKIAGIMHKKPHESGHCLAIIQTCGEIVTIADKVPSDEGFPSFLKLPRELRQRVYHFYLAAGQTTKVMVPNPKKGNCPCAAHEPTQYTTFHKRNLSLAFTSKRMSEEVLGYFYRKKIFHFPCSCEMGHCLSVNPMFEQNVRRLKFHWCGPQSATAISMLKKVRLDELFVLISKNTTRNINPREEEFRRFFGAKRNTAFGGYLSEALGVDELLQIRGLKVVHVEHVAKRKAERRSDDEKNSLWMMLNDRLKQRRDDDEDYEEGDTGSQL